MSVHKKSFNDLLERFLNNLISSLIAIMVLFIAPSFTTYTDYIFEYSTLVFSIITVIISGIVYQAVNDYFLSYKTKFLIHLRTVFFWTIIVLIVCAVLKMDYAPYILLPAILIQYVLNSVLNKVLLCQNYYLLQIENWEGIELSKNLRSDSLPVETLNKTIDRNKTILIVITYLMLVYVLNICQFKLLSFSKSPVLFILFIAAVIIFLFAVSILFVIYNLYKQNTYFAFLGFKTTLTKKYQVIKAVIPILFISLFLSYFLSGNKALIEFEYKNKTGKTITNKQIEEPKPVHEDLNIDIDTLREALGNDDESEFAEVFFKIFEALILAAVIFALLSFMFKYIFTGDFISFFKEFTILKILQAFFQNLADFFRELFGLKKETEVYSTVNSRNFKMNIDSFLRKSKKSTLKKQELDKFTKQFMHVVEWGDKRGIKYRKSFAPAEYCVQIIEYFNKSDDENKIIRSENARLVGFLFEKALYSEELLSKDEVNQFFINSKLVIESK